MQGSFNVIVLIPVGPDTSLFFLRDTIESVTHYFSSSFKIVIADDSQQGIGEIIRSRMPEIDVTCSKKSAGAMAGLYVTLSNAYRYVLENYNFTLLLKLDTDALITGPSPENEALEFFGKQKQMGIAGQYPLDYNGLLWDLGWPRDRIINGTQTWKYIRHPIANIVLRKHYKAALKNGYVTGESVFGGAYFISKDFIKSMADNRVLPDRRLSVLRVGEDHIFSLLAKSLGFELGTLSGPGLPFGCAWKGLPAAPEALLQDGKKIVHSTRGWGKANEDEIRTFFRSMRQQTASFTYLN